MRYVLEIWSIESLGGFRSVDLGDDYYHAIDTAENLVNWFRKLHNTTPDDDFWEVDWDVPAPVIEGKPERSNWRHVAGWVKDQSPPFVDIYIWDTEPEDGPLGC